MKSLSIILGILVTSTLVTGCASVTVDANQQVRIDTYAKDEQLVSEVKCVAKNERGEWMMIAPGTVSVHRSGDNLTVKCDKDGFKSGYATAISRANGGMFGNILLGGGIGAIVDHNKGTAYSYPSFVKVVMGESLIYDRKDEQKEENKQQETPTSFMTGQK